MKRVKQLALMLLASLLAPCVWAAEMYVNTFAGEAEVPTGTYGEIALASKVKATAFSAQNTISGGTGSFAQIMNRQGGRVDTRSHTVAGWFKIDTLGGMLYAAKTANGGSHVGYKVYVETDGKIKIGKVAWDNGAFGWTGNTMATASACVTAGAWHHIAIAITKQGDTNTHTGIANIFVDGAAVSMATSPANFETNLDGETCTAIYMGAGVSVGGFYVDDAVITDATTIKEIALDPTVQTFVGTEPESYGLFYKATKDGESLSGWTEDSWEWDNGSTTDYAVGPNALGAVKRVTNSWHPGEGVSSVSARTIAMYVNTETMTVSQNSEHTLLGLGSSTANNSDSINVVRVGDKLHIAYIKNKAHSSITEDGLDISNMKGYHLVTLTYDTAVGTTLTIDADTKHQLVDTADRAKVQPSDGLQIGTTWGGAVYAKGNGLAVAYVMGFNSAFSKSEIANLSYCYPASQSATGDQVFEVEGGTLTAGTVNLTGGRFNIKRGTLVVPANIAVSTPSIEFGDSQQNRGSGTFGLELDGTINISGASTLDGNGSGGIHANVVNNVGGVLFGNWEGVGTYNIRGTFNAENNYFQPVYDAHKQTINIRNGGSMKVRGIQLANMQGTDHAVYEMNIEEGGVFEIANKSDTNYISANMSPIKGSGTIKFTGSNWLGLPSDNTKMFADTLSVENNLAKGVVVPGSVTIGSLSGSGSFRYDWNDNPRTLTVKQSKNTTWSGGIYDSNGHSDKNRALDIVVKSKNEKTLTVSGTVNGPATSTMTAGEGGTIKITGSCTGTGVVLDGGKLQSTGYGSAHGSMVKSLKLLQDGTYEWVAGNNEQIGIGADGVESKLDLNSHKITFTGKGTDTYNRVYLDKTTIASAGTIEVTKGRLFIHCQMPTFPEGTKIIIGQNATIEIAPEIEDKTMTVTELEYNGTVDPLSNGVPLMVVTSKFSGTGSIKNLTLGNGAEVSGSATVTTAATAQGTVKLMSGTLTVPTALADGKVVSGDDTKVVAKKAGENNTIVYGLVAKPEDAPVVPEEGTTFPEGTVIEGATGAVSGTTLPDTTGSYTVKTYSDGFLVNTATYGVVAAKEAEKPAEEGVTPSAVTTAVAVPFKGKTVATLLNTALLNKDDVLMAWVGGKYETWMLDADKNWGAQTTQAKSGNHTAPAAAEAALKCGQAVWVTTAGQIVTFGDVNATGDTVEVTTGHNLLGSIAYTEAVPQTAETDDQIQLIGEENISRYNKTADGWQSKIQKRTQLPNGKWVVTEETSDEAPMVKPGRGYWLVKPAKETK